MIGAGPKVLRLLAQTVAYAAGLVLYYGAPFEIIALRGRSDLPMTPAHAVTGAIIVAGVVTTLAPSLLLQRVAPQRSLRWAAIATALCHLAMLQARGWALAAALAGAAASQGVLIAGALMWVGSQPDAQSRLRRVMGGSAALVAVVSFALPVLGGAESLTVLHGVLFAYAAGAWAVLTLAGVADSTPLQPNGLVPTSGTARTSSLPLAFIAGCVLLFALLGGMLTYAGDLAGLAGVSVDALGGPLAISALAGVVAAVAAGSLALHWPLRSVMWLGVASGAMACAVALTWRSLTGIALALAASNCGFYILFVVATAMAARRDASGRLPAVAAGAINLSYSIGLAIFGALLETMGLQSACAASVLLSVAGATVLWTDDRRGASRLQP